MRRKGRSLEKRIRYGMRVSGCVLSLLLLGKGLGFFRWDFEVTMGYSAMRLKATGRRWRIAANVKSRWML